MPRQAQTETPAPQPAGSGESVQGYFRRVFKENPRLLKERSNDEVYRRWLADHPGRQEVPLNVKTGLQNLKSVLRKKLAAKKAARRAEAAGQAQVPAQPSAATPRRSPPKGLESLENAIDDCLAAAKDLDREGLAEVIGTLRQARNAVVRKAGG